MKKLDLFLNMLSEKMILDKRAIEVFIVALVLLFFAGPGYAQGPPIFTETPIMLGLEGGGVRTFGKFISGPSQKVYVQPIVVPFNLSNKWQIGGVVPFIHVTRILAKGQESNFGLSDVKLFTKFQIHQKNGKGKTFRTLIKLTETFPTGNTTDVPQLGSDAWQTTLTLVSGYITTKFGLYGDIGYNMTSNNLSNNLMYNFAFGYPLLPQKYPPNQVNVFLELNGNVFTDIGRHVLFVSPGLQYIAGRRFLVESGIQLPIIGRGEVNFIYTLGVRVLLF